MAVRSAVAGVALSGHGNVVIPQSVAVATILLGHIGNALAGTVAGAHANHGRMVGAASEGTLVVLGGKTLKVALSSVWVEGLGLWTEPRYMVQPGSHQLLPLESKGPVCRPIAQSTVIVVAIYAKSVIKSRVTATADSRIRPTGGRFRENQQDSKCTKALRLRRQRVKERYAGR